MDRALGPVAVTPLPARGRLRYLLRYGSADPCRTGERDDACFEEQSRDVSNLAHATNERRERLPEVADTGSAVVRHDDPSSACRPSEYVMCVTVPDGRFTLS
jgi:hypothetical protein